ncbi:hypothetical protein Pelo_440 [Pelomyxa schiedti]|nr:hypothetical protein Pelo_440 [Pelomyxa schiedti]
MATTLKLYRPECGLEFTYVEPVDSNPALASVICSVCKGPFLDPMTHVECGNTFCARCISKANTCPTCSAEMSLDQKVPVRAMSMLQLVDSLMVSCPTCKGAFPRKQIIPHWNKCPIPCPQGCSAQIFPVSYIQHQNTSCSETLVTCPRCQVRAKRGVISSTEHKTSCPDDCPNGCHQKVPPKDLDRHYEVCPEATFTCGRCSQKVKRGKYSSEHVPVCPFVCGCGALVAPKDLATHENSGCKTAPVHCSAQSVLCPWIGPRTELSDHERSCRFMAMKELLSPILEIITTGGAHLPYNNKGKDLSGQDLSRKVMRGWNLQEADLHGCNLEMCDLSMADLSGANLSGANLIQAKLKGAILVGANLSDALLVGATLRGANLTKCIMRKANLVNADLSETIVTGLDVTHANMIGVRRLLSSTKVVPSLTRAIETWPKNSWRELTNLDLTFSDSNLTVRNTTNNTQSTFAEYGIPLGACFTWKIKVGSVDCRHGGPGVAIPSASIGRGNHGDSSGCWKWQAGGLTFTNGTSTDTEHHFTGGDVLTCLCDRRKEPTIFTIAKNDTEVKRFTITTDQELVPFIGACCTNNAFTAEFNIPQPLALELPGALNLDSAVFIDPASNKSAAAKPTKKPVGKYAEDAWRHLSGVNCDFSDGDRTLTNSNHATQSTVSKLPCAHGQARWWAITVNNANCDACGFGVVHENKCECISNTHADSNNCWKWESVGRFYSNGIRADFPEQFATGDVIGLLCDRRPGKHTLSFYKNGTLARTLTGLPDSASDKIFPSITPCCKEDSFTADFCAYAPEEVLREIPGLTPPPPPPDVDISLYPTDTWKQLEGLDMEFQNNKLTVTNPGKRTQCTISELGIPMGVQRYWEVVIEATSCSACGLGVTIDSAQVGMNSYADKNGCWKWEKIGRFFANGVVVKQLTGFVEGDTIGVFVDRTPGKGTVTFYKNGEEVAVLSGLPEEENIHAHPCVVPCCNGASFTGVFGAPLPASIIAAQEAAKAAATATTTSSAAAAATPSTSGGH